MSAEPEQSGVEGSKRAKKGSRAPSADDDESPESEAATPAAKRRRKGPRDDVRCISGMLLRLPPLYDNSL